MERDIAVAMAFKNMLVGDQLTIHTNTTTLALPSAKYSIKEHTLEDGYHKFIIEKTDI